MNISDLQINEVNIEQSVGDREIDISVSISNFWHKQGTLDYNLNIWFYIFNRKHNSINIYLGAKEIDENLALKQKELADYIKGLPLIKELITTFLLQQNLDNILRRLHKEYQIIFVDTDRCNLNFYTNKAFFMRYESDWVFDLKSKHHYLPLVYEVFTFKDNIDFVKRVCVQLGAVINDILYTLGFKHNCGAVNNVIVKKDNEILTDDYGLTVNDELLQRKVQTDSFFYISETLKRDFGIRYSKFCLFNVRKDVQVEIDNDLNIQKATII